MVLNKSLERVTEKIKNFSELRRVASILKEFDSFRSLADLVDVLILRGIDDEVLRNDCMRLNHSNSRLMTVIGHKDYSNTSLKLFLEKEIEINLKLLKQIQDRYEIKGSL